MPKLTSNVHVHGPEGPVFFAEGDELPEWAAGLVGPHVLEDDARTADDPGQDPDPEAKPDEGEPGSVGESGEDESETEDAPDPDEAEDARAPAPTAGVPDFTAAATPRRARTRKA